MPEVWIVDLDLSLVRFFRSPQGDRYLDITATETPGATPVALLPGVMIDLSSVLQSPRVSQAPRVSGGSSAAAGVFGTCIGSAPVKRYAAAYGSDTYTVTVPK